MSHPRLIGTALGAYMTVLALCFVQAAHAAQNGELSVRIWVLTGALGVTWTVIMAAGVAVMTAIFRRLGQLQECYHAVDKRLALVERKVDNDA